MFPSSVKTQSCEVNKSIRQVGIFCQQLSQLPYPQGISSERLNLVLTFLLFILLFLFGGIDMPCGCNHTETARSWAARLRHYNHETDTSETRPGMFRVIVRLLDHKSKAKNCGCVVGWGEDLELAAKNAIQQVPVH